MIPEGTRIYQAPEARQRRELIALVADLFQSRGYGQIELPALELYDPNHDLAAKSFKLVDRNGQVLALRSDFTTAVAQMIGFTNPRLPVRLQYAGQVWLREADTELGRVREYTQFGVEFIGASSPEADAEVLKLASQTLKTLGFANAQIEIGLPSLVRDLLESTALEAKQQASLEALIHRKSTPELSALLVELKVEKNLAQTLLALPDLYGGQEVLVNAKKLHLTQKAKADLDWLEQVLQKTSEIALLFDLGRARRMDYYTGINFQAYTKDFGLPILGGGRYDGTLLPLACGFTVGLERVMEALGVRSFVEPQDLPNTGGTL